MTAIPVNRFPFSIYNIANTFNPKIKVFTFTWNLYYAAFLIFFRKTRFLVYYRYLFIVFLLFYKIHIFLTEIVKSFTYPASCLHYGIKKKRNFLLVVVGDFLIFRTFVSSIVSVYVTTVSNSCCIMYQSLEAIL